MAATQQPRRHPRPGQPMTALHAVLRAFRHANAELQLASEMMFRPPGASQPRPQASAPETGDGHRPTRTEPASQAA